MCNGPSRSKKIDLQLQNTGDLSGDPYEISTLRREDYNMVEVKSEYVDVLQSNKAPAIMTDRGHQFPAAFMIVGSGIDAVRLLKIVFYTV
jgi:leucyl aminopeptidase